MLDSAKVKEMLSQDDIIRLCCSLQEDDTYLMDSQGRPLFLTSLDHEGGDSYKLCYFDDGIVVLSIGYKIEEGNHGCLIYQSKKLIIQEGEDEYNDI